MYYLLVDVKNDNLLTIVWIRDYEFSIYNNSGYIFTDKKNKVLSFYTEFEAIDWLDENIKQEKIDPQYRKKKYNRDDYLL